MHIEPQITIPCHDVGREGPVALIAREPDRLAEIIAHSRRRYTAAGLHVGDRLARRWLERVRNPYLDEIHTVARHLGMPGAFALNLSFEWACSTRVEAAPDGSGMRLMRTLDWPLAGLGRTVVVARSEAAGGEALSATWPGAVGLTTAMVRGRFAVAINQPPMNRLSGVYALDWLAERAAVFRSDGMPPLMLLRQVVDTCADYDEARRMLCETPLCQPAFFSIVGTAPGQGCIIERDREGCSVREAPACIANHWISRPRKAWPRGSDSPPRLAQMEALGEGLADGFDWLAPPVLDPTTRLAALMNPASGRFMVQGWEEDGPATRVFNA